MIKSRKEAGQDSEVAADPAKPMTENTLVLRLKALKEKCGDLCDLEKPVLPGKDKFMGKVTAKVVRFP